MFFYITPYFFFLICSFFYYKNGKNKKPDNKAFFLMLLPAILLVILRGDVGTDTLNYLQHFEQLIDYNESTQTFEPGFEILSRFLVGCGLNPRACVAIIGFLTIIFLIRVFSESRESILFFALMLFPSYFYDMTMNGVRYGLSFAIAALSIKLLYENKILKFVLFALLATSIQYSSVLIIFVFSISKLKVKYLVLILFVIILSFPLYSDVFEYVFLKQEAYSDARPPSATSGIGPMFMFVCLYSLFIYSSGKQKINKVIHVIFLFEILSFYLARYSYAGLRLQSLFAFSLLLFMKNEQSIILNKDTYQRYLFLFGVMSFGLWLKNYVGDVEVVDAPYIPYKFFWD